MFQFLSFAWTTNSVFNGIVDNSSTYRARYVAPGATTIVTTTNELKESYWARPMAGKTNEFHLKARPDHKTEIVLGEIKLEWSWRNATAGWVAGHTNKMTMEVLPAGAFERFPE